ncbi:MAG: hypothetical protein AAF468_06310 [Pseudomonadota bacterium]
MTDKNSNVTEFKRGVDAEAEAAAPTGDDGQEPVIHEDQNDDLGHNVDFGAVAGLVEEIEEAQAAIDEISAKEKDRKAPFKDTIAQLKRQAKEEEGITVKALNLHLTKRRQERRITDRIQALDDVQRGDFDQLALRFDDDEHDEQGAA